MLKKFFLNTLSSFVGTWIALLMLGVVGVLVCVGLAARLGGGGSASGGVSKHSILTINLNGVIEETETPVTPDYSMILQGGIERPQTLRGLVQAISNAKDNKNIEAIYLKAGGLAAGPATLDALRAALLDFKKSGKKIFAYGDSYYTGSYFVASVADSIFINPYGMIEMQGISGTSLYMKGLFDKLGINFQVIKVGTFKSAVEPFIMENMSEPARAQLDTLYGNMWEYIRKGISESRKNLTPQKIDSLVNKVNITFASMESTLSSGLVDAAVYERVMDAKLANLVGVEKKKLNFVSVSDLSDDLALAKSMSNKNQVAVLYATGEIVDGSDKGIDFNRLVPIITDLAENDKIKGLVLRVNSPGGSAFGSDQIGEALDYFQSKGKPLAVSMGDYAASGGYWISCGADIIYADPLTITGSIGIFGLLPNGKGLLDKIGVNPQFTGTNPQANFPSLYKPLDENQLAVMQSYVERGYDRFISRVAKGRKMSEEKVRRIAEGRVWDAVMAQKIGLVDKLGSLRDAIEWVGEKAGVSKNMGVTYYPINEPTFWDLVLDGGTFGQLKSNLLKNDFSELADYYLRRYINVYPVQAKMPDFKVGFGWN